MKRLKLTAKILMSLFTDVIENIKARFGAKPFNLETMCVDPNRDEYGPFIGDWLAKNGKLYFGHPLFIYFVSAANGCWDDEVN